MHRLTKSYFNIVSRQNNIVLLSITNEENNHADSKFLSLSTGGVGFPGLKSMLLEFEKYNGKNKLNELSDFIVGLNAQKIMIYSTSYFSSNTALLIFAKLCKKLDIYCIVFTAKPMRFEGKVLNNIYNETIEEIKPIVDEFYEITDEGMEYDDMTLPMSKYQLKYNKMFQEYIFAKFYTA